MSPEPAPPATVEKRTNTGVFFFGFWRNAALVRLPSGRYGWKEAVGPRSAGVHDPLGNPFVVEMGDLLAEDEVLEQCRPARSGAQRVLVVGNRQPLVGRERLVGAAGRLTGFTA